MKGVAHNIRRYQLIRIAAIVIALVLPVRLFSAEMETYCMQPPYVVRDVAPNIMIMMDNSQDMYGSAYGTTYTPNGNYIGYFNPQACYSYSAKFIEQPKTGGPINCSTASCYTSYTYSDPCPTTAPYRGNLLNWATMSKYDVLQKVVIGGNAVSKQTSANTLLSIGGAWSKTYNNCVFNVSNANLTITETVSGACSLLDAEVPEWWRNHLNVWNRPELKPEEEQQFAWFDKLYSFMLAGAKNAAKIVSKAWDLINPVSTAWAATGVTTVSGSTTGTVGAEYSITLGCSGTGGDCPNNALYVWTFPGKPAWLTGVSYATLDNMRDYRLTLSGMPTAMGTYGPFTVTMTAGTKPAVSISITIIINAASLTINAGSLPGGVVGEPYSTIINGTGGVACGSETDLVTGITYTTYKWTATGLPPGLVMENSGVAGKGRIMSSPLNSGPTASGNFSVTIEMRDCDSPTAGVRTKTLPMVIEDSDLKIVTSETMTSGVVSSAYSATLVGAGGTRTGYSWSITSGYLPFGLFLDSSTGIISGNTCPFIGSGSDGQSGTTCLKTDTFSVISGNDYTVTSCSDNGGANSDNPYLKLTHPSGTSDLDDDSCSSTGGELGATLSFAAASSGVETVCQSTYSADAATWSYNIINTTDNRQCAGTFPFTIRLTDSSGESETKNLSITISSGALSIATTYLPNAAKDVSYSTTLQSAGGVGPYTWAISGGICSAVTCTGGGLPASLSLNRSTGVISGTPTKFEVDENTPYTVTVTLTDSAGTPVTVSKSLSFKVMRALALRSDGFNVRVDIVEETLVDVNGNDYYDVNTTVAGTTETFVDHNGNGQWDGKKGVFQKYWDSVSPRARWGLTKFSNRGTDVAACIPASPASSFYTTIQNATPEDTAPLINGEYGDVNYYRFNNTGYVGCNTSDPIDIVKCRKNFILIISSGADLVSGPTFTVKPDGTAFSSSVCSVENGYQNHELVKNACYGYTNDIRLDKTGTQAVQTFAVFTMGTTTAGLILEDAALAGGGKFYNAQEASNLEQQLEAAFKDMLSRASSGTAASVLASGEGSGANLIQAIFYPRRKFGSVEIDWTGRLSNFWYYVDPKFGNSSIREDDGDKVLDLLTSEVTTTPKRDYITQFYFDTEAGATMSNRALDTNGDGAPDGTLAAIPFEDTNALWEAGKKLWERNLSTSPRTIYTSIGSGLIAFSVANKTTLKPYLQAATDEEAEAIIRWVLGEDTPFSSPTITGFTTSFRNRSVAIGSDTTERTWKLGDVLNSTPKLSTWMPLNTYHNVYQDTTYGKPGTNPSLSDAADVTSYITSTTYRGRDLAFAGANDGMLHAFKLGSLELKWTGQTDTQKARLSGTASDLGKEEWAFIPKHALPYLKYAAEPGYCHIYTVDLTPYIFDASINGAAGDARTKNSWHTILIGGMRFGGACKKEGAACAGGGTDCVKTPRLDPADATKGLGYSSYFALDITDQLNPTLKWEFAHDDLGFATTGPAIVRINETDSGKEGNWFVVFGSGPTGPITSEQFMGSSDQLLKLFVLNLRTGVQESGSPITTSHARAFAGSLLNASLDIDNDYQDDVLYVPYVKSNSGTPEAWTNGGVGRLLTKENKDVNQWSWSTFMDGVGPVTAGVSKIQNKVKQKVWVYYGTGRYFYELQNNATDDGATTRHLVAVKDPCFIGSAYDMTAAACTSLALTNLNNVTNIANVTVDPTNGWFIALDGDGSPDAAFRAERVITDPLATSGGVVYYTTFKPYTDECSIGGTTAIWATKYDTGGSASTLLKGKALIQVSTGSIEQIDLASAFTESGGRKSASMDGVPPTIQGLSVISTPKPVKRVLHMRER